MPEVVGATGDAGTKLKSLLEKLRRLEKGQARIANLCFALEANHVRADRLRDFVADLQHPSDNLDVYQVLLDNIRDFSRNLYFQRPSPPTWEHQVALVLDWSLLDQNKQFHLFSDEYIKNSKSLKMSPGAATDASELNDMLTYIRTGFRRGLDSVGLGEPFMKSTDEKKKPNGRVVFVTPVDEFWEKLTAGRFRGLNDPFPNPGPADQVCDYLGLPYRSMWLVELRSRLTLSELVRRGGLALAAPTVIEAWVHDYFRQWPRGATVDCWGRTLHVGNGLVGGADPQGLPEAIIDHLPPALLSDAFEVSILGRVTARSVPQQKDINNFLVAERDLTVLIDDIVSKVLT
ncbi:MAG: hypothetical protein QOD11_1812 [Bradyrhizobium sp.]|jgi:hypothetical protein|nr:hypothetical protein [Bradyrhizobium sp.]